MFGSIVIHYHTLVHFLVVIMMVMTMVKVHGSTWRVGRVGRGLGRVAITILPSLAFTIREEPEGSTW